MDFFRKLFGGGGASDGGDRDGLYLYVQPDGCDEVIRVRINRLNDLSESDEGGTLFVHKLARGVKCRKNVELDLFFNAQRQLTDQHITGGRFVDVAAWQAWTAAQAAQTPDA